MGVRSLEIKFFFFFRGGGGGGGGGTLGNLNMQRHRNSLYTYILGRVSTKLLILRETFPYNVFRGEDFKYFCFESNFLT